MQNANKIIAVALGAAVALTACNNQEPQEQNIVVDNGVLANADIEALPPDESSATPSDELANGATDPQANAEANASDNY